MAVLLETSLGDIVIDLNYKKTPQSCLNFIKLCKIKYYNNVLFWNVKKDFMVQTGDPTGTGRGGCSLFNILGNKNRYFNDELHPKLKADYGSVCMANAGKNKNASQFFIVTSKEPDLDYLKQYTLFGNVAEGIDVLEKINKAFCDKEGRPLQNIRIRHTIIIDDPFKDPEGLIVPDKSPIPKPDSYDIDYIADTIDLNETDKRTSSEIKHDFQKHSVKSSAEVLELIGDIPHRDIRGDERTLFICKLNPETDEEGLTILFSQFGKIVSCEVIRDYKTGDSLQYAFIEFETDEQCNRAYMKMNNVLVDDRRIKVDWSQSTYKQ